MQLYHSNALIWGPLGFQVSHWYCCLLLHRALLYHAYLKKAPSSKFFGPHLVNLSGIHSTSLPFLDISLTTDYYITSAVLYSPKFITIRIRIPNWNLDWNSKLNTNPQAVPTSRGHATPLISYIIVKWKYTQIYLRWWWAVGWAISSESVHNSNHTIELLRVHFLLPVYLDVITRRVPRYPFNGLGISRASKQSIAWCQVVHGFKWVPG